MAGSAERDGVKTQPVLPPDSVPAAEPGGLVGVQQMTMEAWGGMARTSIRKARRAWERIRPVACRSTSGATHPMISMTSQARREAR